jgi:hypothetical protein
LPPPELPHFLALVHLDKAEAFGAAGFAVHDYLGRRDRAVRREQVLRIAVGRLKGKNSDV